MELILRRANSGPWSDYDFDVFDGERKVGRIYRVEDRPDSAWFWGVSFQVTKRKSYGYAPSLEEAKAAFKAVYEAASYLMTDEERRLLEVLAASEDGSTEALLLAHGIGLRVIRGIIGAGFATATTRRVLAGGRTVTKVRITAAGRRALVGRRG